MLNKELQDLAWAVLPKEFREEVKKEWRRAYYNDTKVILEYFFGKHNLTSDAEGEEMLTVEKSKVMKLYNKFQKDGTFTCLYAAGVLDTLFGSKCLPNELANEDNFATKEPKPAEPINEGTRQEQCVPKNAESGTHLFDNILKDGFREHNRLHIAAMAMQGLMCNPCGFTLDGEDQDKTPESIAEMAFLCADALIARAEKGGEDGN